MKPLGIARLSIVISDWFWGSYQKTAAIVAVAATVAAVVVSDAIAAVAAAIIA